MREARAEEVVDAANDGEGRWAWREVVGVALFGFGFEEEEKYERKQEEGGEQEIGGGGHLMKLME